MAINTSKKSDRKFTAVVESATVDLLAQAPAPVEAPATEATEIIDLRKGEPDGYIAEEVILLSNKAVCRQEIIKLLQTGNYPKIATATEFATRGENFGRSEGNYSIKSGTSIRWYMDCSVECKKFGYMVIRSKNMETGFVDKTDPTTDRITSRWQAEKSAKAVKTNLELRTIFNEIEALV